MSDESSMDWESYASEVEETAVEQHQVWEQTQSDALAHGYTEQDNADSAAAWELAAEVGEAADGISESW